MKVLLLNPPWLCADGRVGIRAGSRWPHTVEKIYDGDTVPFPFFLAYTGAMLRDSGYDVRIIDGVTAQQSMEEFWTEVRRNTADLVLLETSTPSFEYDLSIAEQLKMEMPQCYLVFSGPHVTVFPRETLERHACVDAVLLGEYEEAAVELAHSLRNGEQLSRVAGLVYREGGAPVSNGRRPVVADLDALPLPARDLMPIYGYNDWFCKLRPNVQLLSSRGCTYGCSFCLWPQVMFGGRNYRARSPQKVVDEIELLEREYDFREYYFDDDSININPKHLTGICEEILERKLSIVWSCMGNTGTLTKPVLEKLAASGCEGIKLGAETGNAALLKQLRKGTTIEKTKRAFQLCKEFGIRTHGTFTLGLPGETKLTMRQTADLIFELDPDTIQISLVTPFPGTTLYEDVKTHGSNAGEDWSRYVGTTTSVMGTSDLPTEEIQQFMKETYDKWYVHVAARAQQAA
jgi:radical SAM superfamily enzyme YgiQ (UPF0313 family)